MIVGLDFDNTIVCYDGVFHTAAVERGLIPASVATDKGSVRDFLRRENREDDFTRLQGIVYGAAILRARPFPGVHDFLERCVDRGVTIHIVSHKTRHPILGEPVDLHHAAEEWLQANGFFDEARTGLTRQRVSFELTKQAKLRRIGELACDWFVDDLPEFLGEPAFPPAVKRILFDPMATTTSDERFQHAHSWQQVSELILARAGREQ